VSAVRAAAGEVSFASAFVQGEEFLDRINKMNGMYEPGGTDLLTPAILSILFILSKLFASARRQEEGL
jgi:hypothetical protein